MQIIWSDKADRILAVGVWLGPEHRNWALTKEQVLNAIGELRDADIVILGGDVLSGPDKCFRDTYANWYFEPSTSCIDSDAVSASALKASSYVRNYPDDDAYFVIVTSDA
ncbi:Imm40 family immunity protein [Agrobacterium vitis]|uniref:Immunity protein 40 domain-containing protein n=1 Tax=Agrobacterium vitis TaxID=373 RepID=A0A7K1RHB1_AGRVI|nr:hypothetical protein [Agrobacterium vitis]